MAIALAKNSLFPARTGKAGLFDYCYVGFFAVLFIFLYLKGPILHPDSGGYIHNATIRSPLYPFILSIYTYFWGSQFQALLFFQLLGGFMAVYFTAHTFRCIFKLPAFLFFLITLVLCSPYYGPGLFGNAILTEALCYPLFLLMFAFLLRGLAEKKQGNLYCALFITVLLVLTRGQFLFLFPAFAIILLWISLFERRSFRWIPLGIYFILSIVSSHLLEKTYQYYYHGQFARVPFTGMQLVVAPLYLSKAEDSVFLKTKLEQDLFKDVWTQMKKKKLHFASLNSDGYFHVNTYTHFNNHYNDICWGTVSPLLSKHKLTTPYQIDATLTQMGTSLIFNNLKGFFTLYCLNILFNLGGLYYALLIMVTGFAAVTIFVKTRSTVSMAYLLITLLTAGNYFLIALVEPVLRRYSAYTDVLQVSIFLILGVLAFQRRADNPVSH